MMKMRLIGLFVLIAVSLSACNQYKTQKKIQNLDAAITNYDVALRWASYRNAYDYHVSPDGTKPPANLDQLEEISVTGIEIVEKTINEDHTEANVKAIISYYLKSYGVVKKLKLDQTWWVNEETGQWFVDGEFPKFL